MRNISPADIHRIMLSFIHSSNVNIGDIFVNGLLKENSEVCKFSFHFDHCNCAGIVIIRKQQIFDILFGICNMKSIQQQKIS